MEGFIQLVRLGIGHPVHQISCDIDWHEVQALAEWQGLSAIILDGIDALNTNKSNCTNAMPIELKLEWIGEMVQNYEGRYSEYKKAIRSLAGFYNRHGFKMMVLKGYACGLNWPKPEHRPCGDIDIWLFGKQKEADKELWAWLKDQDSSFVIDNTHHHHSVFEWGEFTVENHYDFINVHHHRSSAELESIFKEFGMDDTHTVDVCGEKVCLPSSNLHALFLLKHSMSDFAAFYVTLRQILDWGFFVEKHTEEIDWQWLLPVLDKYHMQEFFNCINAICVEDLGFSSSIFPNVQFNPFLKEKVLSDILEPKFTREEPASMIPRLIFKIRRWEGNAWKHEMCYNESLWSGFWSGVWNHVSKPASI